MVEGHAGYKESLYATEGRSGYIKSLVAAEGRASYIESFGSIKVDVNGLFNIKKSLE